MQNDDEGKNATQSVSTVQPVPSAAASGIDLYNVFNSNTGTAYNQTYDPVTNGATWLNPTTVLNPRFARFNVTFDF